MKVTVEIDCTADEARAFLGLPDVKPMQAAVMSHIEQQTLRAADSFAPESMLKLWFNTMPQLSSQMQDMFTRLMSGGGGKT